MDKKFGDVSNNKEKENLEKPELSELDKPVPVNEDTAFMSEEPSRNSQYSPGTSNGEEEKNPVGKYILSVSLILVVLILGAMTLANYFKLGVTEKMIVFNGYRYEGEFRGEKPRGTGMLVFGEDEVYKSDNIGTIETDDFRIIAEMVNGIPEGKGFLLRSDGSIYAGDFKEGLMHGEGTFIWPDGSVYEGGYFNNRKEGEGKIVSEEGLKYIGGFKNDMMHGEGVLISPHGMEHEGLWVEGELQEDS